MGPVFKFYLLSKMKTMGSQVLIIYWHTAVPTRTEEQGSRCNIDIYIEEKCSITMNERLFSGKIQFRSFAYLTGFAIYFG